MCAWCVSGVFSISGVHVWRFCVCVGQCVCVCYIHAVCVRSVCEVFGGSRVVNMSSTRYECCVCGACEFL